MRIRALNGLSKSAVVFGIIFSVLLALLTWLVVEKPFRDKRFLTRTQVFAAALVSILALVTAYALGVMHLYVERRDRSALSLTVEERVGPNYGLDPTCDGMRSFDATCRTSEAPEIAVWGDSYAMHLVDALIASESKTKVIQLTKSACGPMLGLAPITSSISPAMAQDCIDFTSSVLHWLERNRSVRYVVLSSRFAHYVSGDSRVLSANKIVPGSLVLVKTALLRTISELRSHGLVPILVSPPPSATYDIGHCLLEATVLTQDLSLCDFSAKDFYARDASIVGLFDSLKGKVEQIRLDQVLCDIEKCQASDGGKTFWYGDTGHLSVEGSAEIGRRLKLYSLVRSF